MTITAKDIVTLEKPDGTRIPGVKANCLRRDHILIADDKLPLEKGDFIARRLPSGLEELFEVSDYHFDNTSDLGPHFRVDVKSVHERGKSVQGGELRQGLSMVNHASPDLSKKSLKELTAMLMPGQAWALVTIIAGMLTAAFSLGVWIEKQSATPAIVRSSRWLAIEGVEAAQHEVARITVSINGEEYISYPAGHVWAEIQPGMPKEKYPLPGDVDKYSLRFGAFLSGRGPTQTVEARCRETDVISVNALPTASRKCELFPSSGSYWGGKSIATVTYSVFGG